MKTRLLLLLLLCASAQIFAQLTLKVIAIPASTPPGESIHVAGNFQGWNPADPAYILTDNGDGTFQITINPPVGLVKYKFTRGSWETVEGNASGGFLPDREYNYTGGAVTEEVEILTWEGQNSTAAANVHLLDDNFYIPQLDRYRRIWIYQPPDYDSSNKNYPVLYMHDGQNLFDAATSFSGEWEVDEALNQLFVQGDYGCIVLGIDNGGALRIDELAPWVNPDYNEGGEGGAYVDFIVETLKPYVDANYRTLPGSDFTGIMGSSLGGLVSQYGIIEHQDVFSKAGIFSPAYWFNDPEIFDHSANTPKTAALKIYSLAGYPEGNGSVVDDVNHMESVMLNNGFDSQELMKVFHADGEHSEWYWAREFPAAYEWLFGGLDLSAASQTSRGKLRLYPNPTDSVLFFENLPPLRKPTYRISAIDGRLAQKGKLEGTSINVGKLPAGAYVLTVFSKRKPVIAEKILVK
ncbi:MAG: T9SS type A sorting domain-containing protein [Bacteroidetes bacterium]|nr:T9SS type A sorting domain-containing protein [Bacteroidota bacterium]